MRFAPLFILPFAACAATLPANPDRITLLGGELAVHFYDGTACRADVRTTRSGQFANCGQVMNYTVVIDNPSLAKGSVLEGLFEPYATVTLTRPSDNRTWTFQTPQSDRVNQNGATGYVKHR